MKFTITILSLAAVALAAPQSTPTQAAAAAQDTAEPWCTKSDQEHCRNIDNAAADLAKVMNAFYSDLQGGPSEAELREAYAPGGAAYFAKRAVDKLALAVSGAQVDPRAYYASLGLETRFAPDTDVALNARDVSEAHQPVDKRWYNWCARRGWTFCKRAVDAATVVMKATEERDQEHAVSKRSPDPWYNWCARRGWTFCKRTVKRSSTTPEEQRAAEERSVCYGPDGECTKAANHVLAMRAAAQDILDRFN